MKLSAPIALLLTLSAAAQTAPKPPAPTAPPSLSDSLKLKFFKAQSELIQASETAKQSAQTVQQKQATFQEAVKEMQTACGSASLDLDKTTGDPVCIAKPEAAKSK